MKTLPNNLARYTLAAILLLAAGAKLASPQDFQQSLGAFQVFPAILIPFLALLVPILELLCACLLMLKNKELSGALLSLLLAICFVISLTIAINTNSIQECGCFGNWELGKVTPKVALLRATLILILSALLCTNIFYRQKETTYEEKT